MKRKINGCEVCGTELKNPESIARKIGPECLKTYGAGLQAAGTSAERIAVIEDDADDLLRRFARAIKQAIGAGNSKAAKNIAEMADRRAALVGVKLPALEAVWCETHFSSDCGDAVAV